MRSMLAAILLCSVSLPVIAQSATPRRTPPRPQQRSPHALGAEMSIKQAMEQLGEVRKRYERDLEVLRRLNAADDALVDPMQPHNAVEKAWEDVDAAKAHVSDFTTRQGIVRMQKELEDARRSPTSADFGRLRALLRSEALAPATRTVATNGAAMQDELLSWIKVQELITAHLRSMSEISAESLRAALQ
jgi:hypothetical protein